MKRRGLFLCSLFLVAIASQALAWNATGHRLVCLVAWEQLPEELRTQVAETLRQHERFEQDFAQYMPEEIQAADRDTQNAWIFANAGVWSDIIRGLEGDERKRWHRGSWHYVNVPYYLSERDEEIIGPAPEGVNLGESWEASMDEEHWKMNVVQSIQRARTRLADPELEVDQRATDICWLFHLVADLHQPMHAVALFSAERFPSGDRGGNDIPIQDHYNLHGTWDYMLGKEDSHAALVATAREWLADPALEPSAEQLADLRATTIRDESHGFARSDAYAPKILEAAAYYEANPDSEFKPVTLDDAYFENARPIAKARVVLAGLRLAAILEELHAAHDSR